MLCLFLFKVFAPFRLIAAVKIGLLFIPSKFSAAIRGKKDNKCGIHDNQAWIWKAQPHGRNKSVFMKPSSSAESCVQKFCKAFPGRNHACKNFARHFPAGIMRAKILQGVSRTESSLQKFCKAFPGRNHACKNFARRFPDGIMSAKILQGVSRTESCVQNFARHFHRRGTFLGHRWWTFQFLFVHLQPIY